MMALLETLTIYLPISVEKLVNHHIKYFLSLLYWKKTIMTYFTILKLFLKCIYPLKFVYILKKKESKRLQLLKTELIDLCE